MSETMGPVPFAEIYVDGQRSSAQIGDRFIYDQKSGTLLIHRDSADIHFVSGGKLSARCFVGRDWSRNLTQASAELYARLGGHKGKVAYIEGSFPTLMTFEVTG